MNAPQFDTTNRFLQSDIEDAKRTLKWLRGEDMSREKKWIHKGKQIPCAWFACQVLAPQNGIKSVKKQTYRGKHDPRIHAIVVASKGHGSLRRGHIGASSWGEPHLSDRDNKRIALAFAARNCIRQLLPMDANSAERAAYRDTQNNALRKYA